MQREPFGEILTETLQNFWEHKYHKPFDVQWHATGTSPKPDQAIDFLCNIYLNAVFPVGTRNGALEPIRREFSRSTAPWRTPFQIAYCKLALSPSCASWFKQATLRVTPPHKAFAEMVIVPGNNKLRILDRPNNVAHGVLKHGFPNSRFRNEIAARQQADQLGIPSPNLIAHDLEAGWFTESYIVGTPLNRLGNEDIVANVTRQSFETLNRLTESTTQNSTVGDYVNTVGIRISDLIEQNHLFDETEKDAILASAAQLSEQLIVSNEVTLNTAQTHGDFQPANILVDEDQFWIIDWEYADRRQLAYDRLVFECQSRRGKGLADRLRQFVKQGFVNDAIPASKHLSDRDERQRSATLLLLEELELRLDENTNPQFTKLDDGLSTLLQEINDWIAAS